MHTSANSKPCYSVVSNQRSPENTGVSQPSNNHKDERVSALIVHWKSEHETEEEIFASRREMTNPSPSHRN